MNGIGKVAVVFVVLAVALAGIGVGYPHWSQTLTIAGTVNTGELDWEFWSGVSIDPQTRETLDWHWNDGFTMPPVPPYWSGDKNVGYTTTVLVDTDLDGDLDTLEVALHNVYPRYFNDISFWIHVLQAAPQGESLTFTMELVAIQWNAP